MGKGSVVPSPEGDARRWFDVVLRALRTPERMMIFRVSSERILQVKLPPWLSGKPTQYPFFSLDDEGKLRSGSEESIL